jgi:hypothetical protein
MFMKKYTIAILVPLALMGAACGNATAAASQPVAQNSPIAGNLPVLPSANPGTSGAESSIPAGLTYPIVDTNQISCYDAASGIACPSEGQAFYGQDAQYMGNTPRYQDNGDGTVSDLVTGLMWQQDPGEKMTYSQAAAGAEDFSLAGYTDWRLPTIKELYSLIRFDGTDASRCADEGTCEAVPFIDTIYFRFAYGSTAAGERIIDSQWATGTLYTGTVFGNQKAMFGVNFADGRIKGYPATATALDGRGKTFFVLYVRGNPAYGRNDFADNGNGTISDRATGLTWTQNDSGRGLDWEGALDYCANLDNGGISDWRLPNAKELQSIVEYNRSPDATGSAAIDPLFNVTTITNEAGQPDFPAFWSSTTHASSDGRDSSANYVAFGRALGYMNGHWTDVHGAGAQRAEDKTGDPSRYPTGHGPQGDAVRIYNYARCVTGGTEGGVRSGGAVDDAPANEGQPPQEAVDACLGLSQGAACTVNTPQGTITGTCRIPPQSESTQLVCVPAGGLP